MPMSPYMASIREKIGTQLLEIPAVSVLTYDEQDRVLLVHHAEYNEWTTPGGAVEPGEVPSEAAVREMHEETGLHVRLEGVLGVYGGPEYTTAYSNGDRVSFMIVLFLGTRLSGDPRPDNVETLDVGWFTRTEVATLEARPWVREVLENAWRDRSRPYFAPPAWTPADENT